MEAEGQQRTVRAEDVAHMGLTEIIRHIPRVYREYRRLVASIHRNKPDLAVLIDFPDVNFRLAKHLQRRNVPVVWFVSPQLWAWKRGRLRWVQQRVAKMLVIFPFEEAFYRARGVDAEFVGHPLADLPLPTGSRAGYAAEHGLDAEKQWIALLPGSRWKEVQSNLPTMLRSAEISGADYQFLIPVASTLDRDRLAQFVARLSRSSHAMSSATMLVPDAGEALHHARASIVASGTATLQAALIGNPFVVVYNVSRLTYAIARRLIRYPGEIGAPRDQDGNLPIAMVNLVAGRRIVPELLNARFTADNLAATLKPLLEDTPQREQMIVDLAETRRRLEHADPSTTAIGRVRDIILTLLKVPPGPSTYHPIPVPADSQSSERRRASNGRTKSVTSKDSTRMAFLKPTFRVSLTLLVALSFALLLAAPMPAFAAPVRPQIQVTGYNITADLQPTTSRLTARAAVTFTALEDLQVATFELNNGLLISKLTNAANVPLTSERVSSNSTVRISLPATIAKGTSTTFNFEYAGTLTGSDTSPVEGIKLAAIADPISILLYAGRWFPISTTGLFTDRFTAEMHISVPTGERVVGTGPTGQKTLPGNRTEFSFNWTKPGFPGTIVAGQFVEPVSAPGISNIHVYVTEKRKPFAVDFAQTAAKEFEFMSSTFGQPESGRINIVELPDDAVSAAWAPEIAAIAGRRIADHNSQRLLANTIAHQWWGSEISPATLNDAWITNGMSRYAELMYVEDASGKTAFQTAVGDVSAGALAYDTEPLTTVGRLDPFSPQFQSMTLEKGAMVFHMLRWELGDDAFQKFLRGLLSQYTDKSVRTANVRTVATAQSQLQLEPFFAQWLDGTGAPSFNDKFTVYRLGSNKGFRTVGAISQDLDLFRMPIELRIETDGTTETRRVDVSGTDSQYTIETFGRPRRISIDPQGWVLKSTPDLAVRVAVLRGQQLVAQGDNTAALIEYQKALDANKNSSLANYRIGEIFFLQRNYQSAANSFRDALRGDGEPKWVEVWAHIELGRIFDITGQRDRAVNEYRLAVQTNDNTQGAVNEARALIQAPYKRQQTDN